MVQAEGYELILGSSIDCTIWSGTFVWLRGATSRGDEGLCVRVAAFECDFSSAHDGENPYLHCLAEEYAAGPLLTCRTGTVLVRFSLLVAEQPWIKEIDVNPRSLGWSGGPACSRCQLDARITCCTGHCMRERSRRTSAPFSDPPLPATICQHLALEGWNVSDAASHSAGR